MKAPVKTANRKRNMSVVPETTGGPKKRCILADGQNVKKKYRLFSTFIIKQLIVNFPPKHVNMASVSMCLSKLIFTHLLKAI